MRNFRLVLSIAFIIIFPMSCVDVTQITITSTPSVTQDDPTQTLAKVVTETIGPSSNIPMISAKQFNLNEIGLAKLSPDGSTLAISGDRGVYLYDSNTLEYKGSISILARGIAFHPDGHILVIVHDGIMQFWNIESGDIKYFAGNTKSSLGSIGGNISFSPDGRYIGFQTTGVCDGVDSKFEVRNVSDGKIIIQRETCAHWVSPVFSFSQDSKRLVLGYMDDKLPHDTPPFYFEIIDMTSGATILNTPKVQVTHTSNDGHTIAVSDTLDVYAEKRNTWIVNAESNETIAVVPYPESFMSFSPDGEHFLVNKGGKIILQDIKTGGILCSFGDFGDVGVSFDQIGDKFILWNKEAVYLIKTSKCIP